MTNQLIIFVILLGYGFKFTNVYLIRKMRDKSELFIEHIGRLARMSVSVYRG